MGIRASRPLDRAGDGNETVSAANILSFRRARGEVEKTIRDLGGYLPLYKAAVRGEWRDARSFLDEDPEAVTARITIASETALHIAVGTGVAIDFVEKLVREMTTENMALTDLHGDTALSVAASVGNVEAAKILVNKNPDLPYISGKSGFPIHKAAQFGHEKMVKYLIEVTTGAIEPNPFVGESGGQLLIDVITADFYEIGLDLVKRYPEIATVEINGLGSPLSVLARKSTAFSSGRQVPFSFSRYFPPAFRGEVKKRDLAEAHALELVKRLCKEILELDDDKVFSLLRKALHNAAKLGIPEIIEEIVEAFPPAIWFTDEDNYNVFQLAVLNRRENVFNLIYQMTDYKFLIARYIDPQDNNILHLVGRLPPSDRLNPILGPALQVQRELQWFEEVSKFVQPAQKEAKNKEGRTPKMEFRDGHEELMKTGAKWLKHTASSSTVVATLIATVSFAGAMHLSRDDKNKDRLFSLSSIHVDPVTVFAATDAISLFFSIASILVFLSIITSQFTEAGFLHALPQRLFAGLTLLFLSIITMASAFSINLYLLFGPTEASNLILLVAYFFLLLVCVAFMPLLLRLLFSINGWKMFGKKRFRILH